MLRLGHIRYSNCVPVHGRLLESGPPESVVLVQGDPAAMDRGLTEGTVDVAPASSIEFSRHNGRYRILPDLSISASGPVKTIRLLSRSPLSELRDGDRIALPTASATSVVLLKIIMQQRFGIQPDYMWFDQEVDDPLGAGAAAVLFIGDVANARRPAPGAIAHDLSEIWNEWTHKPFVFALWQTSAGPGADAELRRLAAELHASRDWSLEHLPLLANRHAEEYGWTAADLIEYWRSLAYGWNEELALGLEEFYRRAMEIGEVGAVPELNFLEL